MHSGMTIWLVEMPEEYPIIERERERKKGEKNGWSRNTGAV